MDVCFGVTRVSVESDPYDKDMQLIHDPISKTILVSFRDKLTTLGPFPTKHAAVKAAEESCRLLGWKG